MARKVKISNMSISPAPVDLNLRPRDLVGRVIDYLDLKLQSVLPEKPDLIVLPENCDRPGSPGSLIPGQSYLGEKRSDYFEARGSRVLDFFREQAFLNKSYIAYSSLTRDGQDHWRNATLLIDRTGQVAGKYYKNHLVIGENSENSILYGTEAPVIGCDFGTVACAICFDLNFTELLSRYAVLHPDIILFSSSYHGGLMQSYWAYACRAHFVGAIGGKGRRGSVISPVGTQIASTSDYMDCVTATVNLDCCVVHLDGNYPRFADMKEKYGDGVSIQIPEYLGPALITSNMDNMSVGDIVSEFGLELLDDYLERSRRHRRENTG